MEMFLKLANECATKEGASSADVDEMATHKPASSKAGKCLRACVAETVGMVRSIDILFRCYEFTCGNEFRFVSTEVQGQPRRYGWRC